MIEVHCVGFSNRSAQKNCSLFNLNASVQLREKGGQLFSSEKVCQWLVFPGFLIRF